MSGYTVDRHEARFERVRVVQERRRSGAAGKHGDRRAKRVRSRSDARRAAITEARRG